MTGVSHFFQGDLSSAQRHIEPLLKSYAAADQRSHVIRFQVDQLVVARAWLSRVLWLRGYPDQALRAVQASVEAARATQHTMSLCYALAWEACPIALWVGDLTTAQQYLAVLLDLSTTYQLTLWRVWGRYIEGVLAVRRSDISAGLALIHGSTIVQRSPHLLTTVAEALGRAGQIAEGLAAADAAIARSEQTENRWIIAETLRIKGELLLLPNTPEAATEAETHFRQALDLAREQGALSWELRAATSLARLLGDQGRSAGAIAILKPVYDRFTEGFDTADLIQAKRVLDELNDVGSE